MTTTTSARRSAATPASGGGLGSLLPYILIAVGLFLVGLALWTEFSGETLLSETVSPTRVDGDTVYTTRPVELDAGEYGLRLDISRVRILLSVGGVGYRITADEHPDWSHQGRMRLRERKGAASSSRWEDAVVSTVLDIPADGTWTLRVEVDAAVDRSLRLRLRTVEADFRVVMYIGLGFLAVGIGMHRPLRERLLAMANRER